MKHRDLSNLAHVLQPFLEDDRHLRGWQLDQVKFEFYRSLYTIYFSTVNGNHASVTIPSEFIEEVKSGNRFMKFRMRNILRHSLVRDEEGETSPTRSHGHRHHRVIRHRHRIRRQRAKDPLIDSFLPRLNIQSQ